MTPTPQPHCEHECVCENVPQIERARNEPCNTHGTRAHCQYDTRSRPAPSPCNQSYSSCPIKISEAAIRKEEREKVLDVVKRLYDVGFKDPLVTVECAIKYIEDPTVPRFPDSQKNNPCGANHDR